MNHLKGQTSPYLLQHLGNPVDWYPWNTETLQKAKDENKLTIISIGYAACHWCHVMEKESFEDQEVAALMNTHFVSIKVDREERPDVDQVYMFAAYAVTGRGGWPLNVIALPDGRPVYAGTYFPKRDWLYLLGEIAAAYRNNPAELEQQAAGIHRRMQQMESKPSRKGEIHLDRSIPDRLFDQLRSRLDFEEGGTHGAPKFPMPGLLQFILHYGALSDNEKANAFLRLTLDKMACGGIYDQIGGGFCRYSTDDRWHIPHFEKMLYDNAQLVSLYGRAYIHCGDSLYADVVKETLAFVERELMSPEGMFYASIDADSEGREGAYYSWSGEEVKRLLQEGAISFMGHYNMTEEGNWEEGLNVPWNPEKRPMSEFIQRGREILFNAREKRIRPQLDNKVITSWNGMMISGYVDAYKALGEDDYLRVAIRAAEIYAGTFKQTGRLFRLHNPAKSEEREAQMQPAFLDDYAHMIKAFTDLYQATFDARWLETAESMVPFVFSHFHDAESGLFYFTSDEDPALIDRRMECSDNVIPSSNAVMAHNLWTLGHLMGRANWVTLAEGMLKSMVSKVFTDPSFYAHWAELYLAFTIKPFEVSIVGSDWKGPLRSLHSHFLPFVLFSGGDSDKGLEVLKGKWVEGKTVIYVCHDRTCSAPFDTIEKAFNHLNQVMEHG
jgi:uncharacterized protein YyaL (SSP411 family)